MLLAEDKTFPIDDLEKIVGFMSKKTYKKQNIEYYNLAVSFDIEVSSFYTEYSVNDKVAIMYEWTFCIEGYVFIGRTWEEFIDFYSRLVKVFDLSKDKRLVVYVHNLGYEFQFIRERFDWAKVFSLDKRRPVKALTIEGVEFRCSYILSGYSLSNLSKQLLTYKVKKMVGDLDYSLIRTPQTELTKKELQYCINDTLVVVAYIRETIDKLGNITRIPLTKTGYVREYTRNECLYIEGDHGKRSTNKYKQYRKMIRELELDADSYTQCKRAFQGGFTHASCLYSTNSTTSNVDSYDFVSSYPAVMCSEKFPMSKPMEYQLKDDDDFFFNLKHYCCIFDIEFEDIESTFFYENYISSSHCRKSSGLVIDNGRVVSANRITTTITEVDYDIIKRVYSWKSMRIFNFRRYIKGYLPKPIIMSVLKLYQNKTILKGVVGKESEYMRSKEDLNSEFGMCVTDICRPDITYFNDEWKEEPADIENEINKYNSSVKRVLYYPWGIYITAYARRNLWSGILECGEDYIYSDTDSVKIINNTEHSVYFENYNRLIYDKCCKVLNSYNISLDYLTPKNIKGEIKTLGVWEHEIDKGENHSYKNFKTLGAKRYMYEKENGEYSLTVSGLNKYTAIPYMKQKYGDKIFESFDEGLHIPKEYSGRRTHTYIDERKRGIVKDYLGQDYLYDELSGVHIEESDYTMSMTDQYLDFLFGVQEIR